MKGPLRTNRMWHFHHSRSTLGQGKVHSTQGRKHPLTPPKPNKAMQGGYSHCFYTHSVTLQLCVVERCSCKEAEAKHYLKRYLAESESLAVTGRTTGICTQARQISLPSRRQSVKPEGAAIIGGRWVPRRQLLLRIDEIGYMDRMGCAPCNWLAALIDIDR